MKMEAQPLNGTQTTRLPLRVPIQVGIIFMPTGWLRKLGLTEMKYWAKVTEPAKEKPIPGSWLIGTHII